MTGLRAGSATDVGLARANNQDRLLVASPIFAVADGMGGHAAGEVASQTAVDALRESFASAPASPQGVVEAARAANRVVWNEAQAHAELRGMGTTLTAIALVPDGGEEVVAIVNVGDSRTYLLRDGQLEQITVDHSYVAELVAGGQIDAAEAEVHPQRHVLTRALGVSPDVDVDLLILPPRLGDRYLLCSDGLSREVTDSQVASTLRRLADPAEAARELVLAAKLHGGNDNITVVVVDIVGDGPGPGAVPEAIGEEAPTGAMAAPDWPGADGSDGSGGPGSRDGPMTASIFGTISRPLSTAPPDAPVRLSRRERRLAARAAKSPSLPRARIVTVRVVGFSLLLVAIVVVAAVGTEYYARSTYYVGLRARQLTIFKGRPGGVLWWKPTIAKETGVTTDEVEGHNLAALTAGVQESTLAGANAYVRRLQAEKATDTPTTTAPTTVPTTARPTTVRSSRTPPVTSSGGRRTRPGTTVAT